MAADNPAAGSTDPLNVAGCCPVAHELCHAAAACWAVGWPKHSQLPVASLSCLVHAPCNHVTDEALLGLHAHVTAPAVEAKQLLLLLLLGGSTVGSRAPSSRTYPLPATQPQVAGLEFVEQNQQTQVGPQQKLHRQPHREHLHMDTVNLLLGSQETSFTLALSGGYTTSKFFTHFAELHLSTELMTAP